jgi:hypothetical protein
MEKKSTYQNKIIEMCQFYEKSENPKDSDKEYWLNFWEKQNNRKNYCGRQGLHTIIDYYVENRLNIHWSDKRYSKTRERYYKTYACVLSKYFFN